MWNARELNRYNYERQGLKKKSNTVVEVKVILGEVVFVL